MGVTVIWAIPAVVAVVAAVGRIIGVSTGV
jgi:hypothetical protein